MKQLLKIPTLENETKKAPIFKRQKSLYERSFSKQKDHLSK